MFSSPPPSLRIFTALNITTYGVSDFFRPSRPRTSLNSLVEERGAMCAVYDEGIEMPSAGVKVQPRKQHKFCAYTHVLRTLLPHPNTLGSTRYLQTSPEALLSGYRPFRATPASSCHQNGVEPGPSIPFSASPAALEKLRTRLVGNLVTENVGSLTSQKRLDSFPQHE